ncbi:Uncharacterised protein [Vibrio cholerae]|uniref:Uncharacterized protein n=1 Tax=Vibrio cholerae TaxID=666 RepID=A0A655SID1_VIBCL|nr:Uncharacterised protein [Vibrio cholerae]
MPFLRIMLFNPLCFLIRGSNFLRIFNGRLIHGVSVALVPFIKCIATILHKRFYLLNYCFTLHRIKLIE